MEIPLSRTRLFSPALGLLEFFVKQLLGAVHYATVETWPSPHFCVKNIFSRDSDQLIVANGLPVGYAPGAQSFPVLPSAKRNRHFDPCSVVFERRSLAASTVPDVPFGKQWPKPWRSTIAGAPLVRSVQATPAQGV
jgi:hypothetical protein